MSRTSKLVTLAILLVASAAWASAPAGRYTISADNATVKDNKTGLTWQRAVVPDLTGKEAKDTYCPNLNLGGFSTNWRLPTGRELLTLVDLRVDSNTNSPTIDLTAFLPDIPRAGFWTATTVPGLSGAAWVVDFYGNYLFYNDAEMMGSVRCVR